MPAPKLSRRSRLAALYYTVRETSLHLFANDHEPTDDDVLTSYAEPSFPGYAPIPLTFDDWAVDGLTLTYPAQEFTLSIDLDTRALVYGWFVSRGTDIVLAYRDTKAPHRLLNRGSAVRVPNLSIGDKG